MTHVRVVCRKCQDYPWKWVVRLITRGDPIPNCFECDEPMVLQDD